MIDDRPKPQIFNSAGQLITIEYGAEVDSDIVHNVYVNWNAPWDLQLSLAIVNLLDDDPPQARHQLGYDPYIGDPLGRTIRFGITKRFDRNSRRAGRWYRP